MDCDDVYEIENPVERLIKQVKNTLVKVLPDLEYTNNNGPAYIDYKFKKTPDFMVDVIMREYQILGLNWLIYLKDHKLNGILADEMGLGKTIQTISLLGYLFHCKEKSNPHLIICPKSTLQNWMDEINRWCPFLRTFFLFGPKHERQDVFKKLQTRAYDILVTSYTIATKEHGTLKKINWNYVVLDEGHTIKNWQTVVFNTLNSIKSNSRLILTGTPVSNNLQELWTLLNYLNPTIFCEAYDLKEFLHTSNLVSKTSIMDQLK
uniref:Helicase ATP-binding domain-containing protein n=1 Tax=Megaselia scalaris TaxID=36166 RepID=T1GMA1_MEGSC